MAGKKDKQMEKKKEKETELFGANMKNKAEITDTLSDILITRVK